MKTIELYEKTDTAELKKFLKYAEKTLEHNEILMKTTNENNLKKENIDLEIDISLIRMELNRRLYNDEF